MELEPTVGQANASLRAQANNAAWWLNHWATCQKLDDPMVRSGMAKTAKLLTDAVTASNKALDREAFTTHGPCPDPVKGCGPHLGCGVGKPCPFIPRTYSK